MLFSQRIGVVPTPTELKADWVTPELRNLLWTAFHSYIVKGDLLRSNAYAYYDPAVNENREQFITQIWIHFFKYPIDTIPQIDGDLLIERFIEVVRKWFFKDAKWFELFDFLEFCFKSKFLLKNSVDRLSNLCNIYFEKEYYAYRVVNGEIVKITSAEEIEEIEKATNLDDQFAVVRVHLNAALALLSNRENPDFRNSMKESISAVEALCKIITGDKNATLGDSLKVIEKKYPLHESLKKAFSALYGYTSDKGGIRHSLKDEVSDLRFEDAKFMLVTCSAFVNYLIAKMT